jgi:hypothetical protein
MVWRQPGVAVYCCRDRAVEDAKVLAAAKTVEAMARVLTLVEQ